MVVSVSDLASNFPEQLEHYAKLLAGSQNRQRLFAAVYRGKRATKTVTELAEAIGLSPKRVLELAKPLSSNGLFEALKPGKGKRLAYRKYPAVASHKGRILSLARNKRKLEALPTKRKVPQTFTFRNVTHVPHPRHITVDDIEQFAGVRKVKNVLRVLVPARLPESTIKEGLARLVGETNPPPDWGGEQNDLFSTNVRISGRRYPTVFAFKGPGTTGTLTPGKMGKRGDQIQRLFESLTPEVFFVQFEGEIDPRVLDLLKTCALARSVLAGRPIRFGVIDRRDTYRLRVAYPKVF